VAGVRNLLELGDRMVVVEQETSGARAGPSSGGDGQNSRYAGPNHP
jgi:hypothetical protein